MWTCECWPSQACVPCPAGRACCCTSLYLGSGSLGNIPNGLHTHMRTAQWPAHTHGHTHCHTHSPMACAHTQMPNGHCTYTLMPVCRVQALHSRLNKRSNSSMHRPACASSAAWGISQATLAWFRSAGAQVCKPCKPRATSARQPKPLVMLLCMQQAQTEVCPQSSALPACCDDVSATYYDSVMTAAIHSISHCESCSTLTQWCMQSVHVSVACRNASTRETVVNLAQC